MDKTLQIITDFRELKWFVRRPYPISKISITLQKLGNFTYAKILDPNKSYYTIRLDPKAVKIFTIIFPWGTIGISGSADIFQTKMMDLMETPEYVQA